MVNQTKKFKDIIQETKNTNSANEDNDSLFANKDLGFGFALLIGIGQLSLIYLSYYLLSSRLGWAYIPIWEFMGISMGVLSMLAFIRTYIKDIRNTQKRK